MVKRRLYKKKCLECGKEFFPFHWNGTFCSNKCSALWRTRKARYEKRCLNCGKQFITRKRRNQFFCSRKCYLISKPKSIDIKCIICGKTRTVISSEFRRGNPKYCSKKCQGIGLSKQYIGKNNPSFKDGKSKTRTLERDQYRCSIEYKNFLRTVFIRDKNICMLCGTVRKRIKNGKGKNNNLTVHHIKSWKDFPTERFNPDNGICICNKCHTNIHRNIKKYHKLAKGR